MTLEELLECSTEKLESFSEAQLTEWFRPMFPLTRPELSTHRAVVKQKEETLKAKRTTLANDPRIASVAKEASKYGIDLNELLRGI